MPRVRGNALVAGPDLLRIHAEHSVLVLEISLWILAGALAVFFAIQWLVGNPKSLYHKYELVKLNVQLGNVGAVELRSNNEDVQIAHRIWTELMTRKAAQPIDVEHDVIVEIYNSWYALFGRVRQLISDIPGHMLRKEKSTQELVRIATQTLNNGLRPHLTRWQARFRHWYDKCPAAMKEKCPQDCQRQFPDYDLLIADIEKVNLQLIQYAGELEKIIHGTTGSR
jgi:hypothetical protein